MELELLEISKETNKTEKTKNKFDTKQFYELNYSF